MDREITVLVVDDEPDLADLYGAWLADDYEVRTAYGGEEALSLLDGDVDVALVDRLMPDLSGDDVLSVIREEEYDCRVAMVTAVEPDFDILEMGFDEYLVKPVRRDELLEAVETLRARAEYDDQLQRYFSLVSKRAALLSQKGEHELEESAEYRELTAEIESVRQELDETVADLDSRDFEVALRNLGE